MMCLGGIILGSVTGAIVASTPVLLVSLFPANIRNTGVGFAYNLIGSVIVFAWPVIIPPLNHYFSSAAYTGTLLIVFNAVITFFTCIVIKYTNSYYSMKAHASENKN